MSNSGNIIDLDLIPGNIRDTVDIFGVVGNFTGSSSGPSLGSLYPGQSIYAMLSPLHRISGNYDNVNAGFACLEISGVKYYFMTMALSVDQALRSTNCITSVGIDNGGVFSNILVNWGGSVAFTGTWNAPDFYLDGTDIHCNHNTNFGIPGHRYVTFDTTTNLFSSVVSGNANTRHILGFNGLASVDTLTSVNAVPTGTLITNSFVSGGFTYTSNVVGDNTITDPGSNPVGRTIGGIHVATKV